jgi:hypothetical protein
MQNGIRIGESPLGRGVFATRVFLSNQVFGRVMGQVFHDPGYESDYCIDLDEGRSFEPAPPFRYLNHSCDPNCELVFCEVPDGRGKASDPEVWIEALQPIQPGDQLTIDYAWAADASIPCRCESPNCRGWIVAAEEVHLLHTWRLQRGWASNRTASDSLDDGRPAASSGASAG